LQRRKLLPLIAVIVLSLAASFFGAAPRALADDTLATPLAAPVWLCYPGMADNPCGQNADGAAQSTASDGSLQTQYPVAGTTETIGTPDASYTDDSASSVDCFYIYPTVDTLPNPILQVGSIPPTPQDAEMAVTLAQVARFAKTCRLFVPVYRQASLPDVALSVLLGLPTNLSTADMDVLQAWQYYWANDNINPATGKRRGVVLLGHSQGSSVLINLIQQEIDGTAETSWLCSAATCRCRSGCRTARTERIPTPRSRTSRNARTRSRTAAWSPTRVTTNRAGKHRAVRRSSVKRRRRDTRWCVRIRPRS
jgi:hypothetical protein